MLKTTLFAAFLLFATGCSTSRQGAVKQRSTAAPTIATSSGSPQLIDDISINPMAREKGSGSSVSPVGSAAGGMSMTGAASGSIEHYSEAQFKFAILENSSVEELNNPKLLSFMDYWYGAPYHYGGMSRDGVDCSAFAFLLMSSVYGVSSLPRTSKEQYTVSRRIGRDQLQEGDLVFFHTLGRRRAVTHVGVYLRNGKFIHASVSGVMINDLSDSYYNRHYVGAGRVLNPGTGDPATAASSR